MNTTIVSRFLLLLLCFVLIIPSNQTTCASGQFESAGICHDCHVTCAKCTSSSSTDCTQCTSTRLKTNQQTCPCKDGYVEYSPSELADCEALQCDYSCGTCNNTGSYCTSCPAQSFRTLNSGAGTCNCNSKYVDTGNEDAICAKCHYSCGECSAANDQSACTQCSADKFREKNANKCICINNYYDISNNEICGKCSHKCQTCSGSATNCLTCPSDSNRDNTPTCSCLAKYFDDNSSPACQPCNYTCATCTNRSQCATCDSSNNFREQSSQFAYCKCKDGYFEKAQVEKCEVCDITCLTCFNQSKDGCINCPTSSNREITGEKKCVCKVGFFEYSPIEKKCGQCNYRCKTCSGGNDVNNCLTCSAALFRKLDSDTNKCPCITGYYESGTGLCEKCHPSCLSCMNGSECQKCDTDKFGIGYVINSSKLCSCNDVNYFNVTQNICKACYYACKTCEETSPVLCVTCDETRTLSDTKVCVCNELRFDDGESADCKPCHYSCQTCNGLDKNNCLSCSTTQLRVLSIEDETNNQCLCKDKYYDDGNSNMRCMNCPPTCKTCTNGSSCASCDATLFREQVDNSDQCLCMSKYYQHPSTKLCESCDYSCKTCKQEKYACQSCNQSASRVKNDQTLRCDCPDAMYDNGLSEACQDCLPECQTCTNSSKCVNCDETGKHRLLNNGRCKCKTKFYDPDASGGRCQPCAYYCATCVEDQKCETCRSSANRLMNNSTGKCVCKSGYFDVPNKEQCQKCKYSCKECNITADNCIQCDTTLRLYTAKTLTNPGTCTCFQRFYDDNQKAICPACDHSCSTCTNITHCTDCNSTKNRQFDPQNTKCACKVKFYDDSQSQKCQPCNYTCASCTNSSKCKTCNPDSHRISPDEMCPCDIKYYDTGLQSEQCEKCHHSCATCIEKDKCAQCDQINMFRIQNPQTEQCSCKEKYYDDLQNEKCLPCIYSCATCDSTSSNCLTCDENASRELIKDTGTDKDNTCPCKSRYYDEDQICKRCSYTCQTCSDGDTCDTCDETNMFRIPNPIDDLCKCKDGYYEVMETKTQLCKQCDLSCQKCVDSNKCTQCDQAKNRVLNATADYAGKVSPFCVCLYSHYSLTDDQGCQSCHYSCDVCNGGQKTDCLYCNASSFRSLTTEGGDTYCKCKAGYYDDLNAEMCGTCDPSCSICTGPANTQCQACNGTTYLLIEEETCYQTCPSKYFNNNEFAGNLTCDSCPDNCLKCYNSQTCNKCAENYYLLYDGKCYQICPDMFYKDQAAKECMICPEGCLTCESNIKCMTCYTHYYFDDSPKLCYQCSEFCLDCSGPSQDQCKSCREPLYFKNSKSTCKNLTCPYGQYVDSIQGCLPCTSKWPNSLTCNKTTAFLCLQKHKLSNGECKLCEQLLGYHSECNEICGDGLLFEYQCDDGNTKSGDGCSQNCLIQKGWRCDGGSPIIRSECVLQEVLTLEMIAIQKYSGQNRARIAFTLSLPIRLSNEFMVQIQSVDESEYSWMFEQVESNLSSISLLLEYSRHVQGKTLKVTYDNTKAEERRRMLLEQHSQQQKQFELPQEQPQSDEDSDSHSDSNTRSPRILSASTSQTIQFSTTLSLDSFPPVLYYPQSHLQFFNQSQLTIWYLCIILLCLSFLGILVVKRMHLHSVSFVYIPAKVFIMFGLAIESQTDWINYLLKDIKPMALIGGISGIKNKTIIGQCCVQMSEFYEYETELGSNSFFVLVAWTAMWLTQGVLLVVNKYIKKIPDILFYSNYFTLTLHLIGSFHVTYASVNTLYFYTLQTARDAVNTCVGIAILLLCLVSVVLVWTITYYSELKKKTKKKNGFRGGKHNQTDLVKITAQENPNNPNQQQSLPNKQHLKQRDSKMIRMITVQEINEDDEGKNVQQQQLPSSGRQEGAQSGAQSSVIIRLNKNANIQGKKKEIGNPNQTQQDKRYFQQKLNRNKHIKGSQGLIIDDDEEQNQNNSDQEDQHNPINVYNHNDDSNYPMIINRGGFQQLGEKYQQQNLLINPQTQYTYSSLQQQNQLGRLSQSFLLWDYLQLYKSEKLKPRSKYYLPVTCTVLYIQAMLMSLMYLNVQRVIFMAVMMLVQLCYAVYLVYQRPFWSAFTNFRLIVIEILFLALQALMVYYLYESAKNQFWEDGQVIFVYILAFLLVCAVLFAICEHALAWRKEVWNIVEPCLIALRLKKSNKVHDYNFKNTLSKNEIQGQSNSSDYLSSNTNEEKPATAQPQQQDDKDGFYERVLKKDKINKKYRRQRKLR